MDVVVCELEIDRLGNDVNDIGQEINDDDGLNRIGGLSEIAERVLRANDTHYG